MSKSAEEIREELVTRRKRGAKEKIVTAHENGQHNAPWRCERDERAPAERKLNPSRSATVRRPDIHRAPPHSVEAEMGVLASIASDPRKYIPVAQQSVGPEHFYVPR